MFSRILERPSRMVPSTKAGSDGATDVACIGLSEVGDDGFADGVELFGEGGDLLLRQQAVIPDGIHEGS
jgi:hypothetical protein